MCIRDRGSTGAHSGGQKRRAFFARRERSHAQETGACFALPVSEHGEHPPFDRSEHVGRLAGVGACRRAGQGHITHRYVTEWPEMALSDAERARLYRERRKAGEKLVRYRRPADRRSKPQQWVDAVETVSYTHLDVYKRQV